MNLENRNIIRQVNEKVKWLEDMTKLGFDYLEIEHMVFDDESEVLDLIQARLDEVNKILKTLNDFNNKITKIKDELIQEDIVLEVENE